MMKRFLLILFVLTIILTGCVNVDTKNNDPEETTYKKISAEDAKKIIDSEDVIVLDVRTPEEFNEGHIENAVLLPVSDIKDKAGEVLTDKDAKILVYCRSGNRSATAAKELIEMGYTDVYDFGGIMSWPYEIVK
jgi:rhodanese-related sulfurtransferase